MNPSTSIGRFLVLAGIVTLLIGLVFLLRPYMPFLGKIPGDFSFTRGNTRIFIPLGTCIVISVVLTLLLSMLRGK